MKNIFGFLISVTLGVFIILALANTDAFPEFGSANTDDRVSSQYLIEDNVNDIGLTEEEDKEVLRVALVASTSHKTFLVTTDYHFLRNLNRTELSKRYPAESRKIKIVSPSDPNFNSFLIACLI